MTPAAPEVVLASGHGVAELVRAILAAVDQEYPHRLAQELTCDADLAPPRVLNPSFYGSYDWHSAVHCHWSLLRCLDSGLPSDLRRQAVAVLDRHLAPEALAGELSFWDGPGGRHVERPYGWAWLVALHAECLRRRDGGTAGASGWAEALRPLAELLGSRLESYFGAELAFPIRSGTHANSAYSLRLLHRAGVIGKNPTLRRAAATAAERAFGTDGALPFHGAPSGDAFVDPSLTEAALIADLYEPDRFAGWFARACPPGAQRDWSPPGFERSGEDPGRVHLEGLLITRAGCLHRVASALPAGDPLAEDLRRGVEDHLAAIRTIEPTDGFGRSHWLPTFLVDLDRELAG